MRCYCDKSLADIVIHDAGSVPILEKYSLDFSCKGCKTLRQACREKSIQVEMVASELKCMKAVGEEGLPFDKLSLASLANYIVHTHHDYLREQLPGMRKELERLIEVNGWRIPILYRVLQSFRDLEAELTRHLNTEENLIFPRIREIEYLASGCNSEGRPRDIDMLSAPLGLLHEQHENSDRVMMELLNQCLELSVDKECGGLLKNFTASLKALRTDIHQHMHLENNVLFPRASKLSELIN